MADPALERTEELRESCTVLQERLFESETRFRILHREGEPPEGFEPVEATLEDAYLSVMRRGAGLLPEAQSEVVGSGSAR